MKKFLIKKINVNSLERFVTVENIEEEKKLKIYYLSPIFQDVESVEEATEKIGNILEGILKIEVLEYNRFVVEDITHLQPFEYATIYAIVEIIERIDIDTFWVKSSLQKDPILLNISLKANNKLTKGEKIFIYGTLKLEFEEEFK